MALPAFAARYIASTGYSAGSQWTDQSGNGRHITVMPKDTAEHVADTLYDADLEWTTVSSSDVSRRQFLVTRRRSIR